MNENLIKIGGYYHIAFLIFHIMFWKVFDWKKDLKSLSYINRAVMQILNIKLIYVFLVFSFISIFYTKELLTTELGFVLIVSIMLFWLFRTIEQLIFFDIKNSKSIILTFLFIVGFGLYLLPIL